MDGNQKTSGREEKNKLVDERGRTLAARERVMEKEPNGQLRDESEKYEVFCFDMDG